MWASLPPNPSDMFECIPPMHCNVLLLFENGDPQFDSESGEYNLECQLDKCNICNPRYLPTLMQASVRGREYLLKERGNDEETATFPHESMDRAVTRNLQKRDEKIYGDEDDDFD